jgi:hypothetical protein
LNIIPAREAKTVETSLDQAVPVSETRRPYKSLARPFYPRVRATVYAREGQLRSERQRPAIARQMSEKLCDFGFRHPARMPFVVKQNEASDPIDITLFSTDTEMLASDNVANLVEQFRFVLRRCRG